MEGRLVIVGLGLMGGSLARAARAAGAPVIVGVDRDPATRAAALAAGAIDQATAELAEAAVQPLDLVVLAVPVRAAIALIEQLPRSVPDGCLLLDLGSTKQAICRAMSELPGWFQAIGGHPMCGRETSGFAAGAADLYRDQTFLLTPTVRTTPYLRERCLALIDQIGARPLFVPPERHDQIVALVSHLPYLLSALLVQQAAAATAEQPLIWPVSASGFRDMARLAGSDPVLWRDILLTNREAVRAELQRFQALTAELDALLAAAADAAAEESDAAAVLDGWLTACRAAYDDYRRLRPL